MSNENVDPPQWLSGQDVPTPSGEDDGVVREHLVDPRRPAVDPREGSDRPTREAPPRPPGSDQQYLDGDLRDDLRGSASSGRLSPDGAKMMWGSPTIGAASAPPPPRYQDPVGAPGAEKPTTRSATERIDEPSPYARVRPHGSSATGGVGPSQQPEVPRAVPAQPRRVDDLRIVGRAQRPPRQGWRRVLYAVSGGTVNRGPSPAELVHDDLVSRINHPISRVYKIAFVSVKGGVGKTTVAKTTGSVFASERADRVIAVDANPDLGTLADRGPRGHRFTVTDLLESSAEIESYSDVRAYTTLGDDRLELLASDDDPSTSEMFSEQNYLDTLRILERFYSIVITDCGTGIKHPTMHGVLGEADALVVVSPTAQDGARSAEATLNWLRENGHERLINRTVVAINATNQGAPPLDVGQLEQLFLNKGVRSVRHLPFDPHLREGGAIDLKLLSRTTRQAYLELAADLADDFPTPKGRHVRR